MIHLYFHVGSRNHGCEAIVRSTAKLVGQPVTLWSFSPGDDIAYGLSDVVRVCEDKAKKLSKTGWKYYYSAISHKLTGNDYRYIQLTHTDLQQGVKPGDICMSIGGDNYCYSGTDILGYYNRMLRERGAKTVLWGCSIEPDFVTKAVKRDLESYDLITVRDTMTYESLKEKGINHNVIKCADPAFLLEPAFVNPIDGFRKDNTIGINVSPLIMERGRLVRENYIELIRYILNETADNILLIPHVVTPESDDRNALLEIGKEFESNSRILLINDHDCRTLKGYIAGCKFFIGARTHSVVAAYSSCVPTLAVGYSIKARGIAKDIFGSCEKYVISVEDMKKSTSLVNAYLGIAKAQKEIEVYLRENMPSYKQKAGVAADALRRLSI